jgi:hypothetical protein
MGANVRPAAIRALAIVAPTTVVAYVTTVYPGVEDPQKEERWRRRDQE